MRRIQRGPGANNRENIWSLEVGKSEVMSWVEADDVAFAFCGHGLEEEG